METLSLTYVIDHIVLQELINIISWYLAQLHAVDPLEGCPGFKSVLLGQLLALLFHDLLVLTDGLKQLKDFVISYLRQHIYFSSKTIP